MRLFWLSIAIYLAASCQNSDFGRVTADSSFINGWADSRYVFSSKTIRVCFEDKGDFDAEFTGYRESIRANVVSDFSKTDITFVGWTSCESFTSIENGIRVSFVNGSKLGASVHGQSNLGTADGHSHFRRSFDGYVYAPTLTINSTKFRNYNSESPTKLSAKNSNMIIHEFGHALGMMHEHVRNAGCENYGEATYEDMLKSVPDSMKSETYVSTPDYDPTSIMDYCHIFDLARKGEFGGLSAGDISVINQLYGGIVDSGPASSGAFPDEGIIDSDVPERDDSPIVIEKEEAISGSSSVPESSVDTKPASPVGSSPEGEIIGAILGSIADLIK